MRTVVALFDRFEDAQMAVQALRDAGFNRTNINLIARDATGEYGRFLKTTPGATDQGTAVDEGTAVGEGTAAGAGIGAVLGGLGGFLLGLGALAIPGIGPVIAAGPIVAGLAGAGVGAVTGGLIGALVGLGIPEEHANYYAEGIRRGGTLVTISAPDERADEARDILNNFNPVDIETRAKAWQNNNWGGFNETAGPLPADQMEFNRVKTFDAGRGAPEHARTPMHEDIPVTGPVTGAPTVGNARVNAPGSAMDWNYYDQDFRTHYQNSFATSGRDYTYYQPAYRYGYDLANNPQYRGYDWNRIEPIARQNYQQQGIQGAWDDVKDAVRHAWNSVTNS